jgi:hypothetical protein
VAAHAAEVKQEVRERAIRDHSAGDADAGLDADGEWAAFRTAGFGALWCVGGLVHVATHLGEPNFGRTLAVGGGTFLFGLVFLYFGFRQLSRR